MEKSTSGVYSANTIGVLLRRGREASETKRYPQTLRLHFRRAAGAAAVSAAAAAAAETVAAAAHAVASAATAASSAAVAAAVIDTASVTVCSPSSDISERQAKTTHLTPLCEDIDSLEAQDKKWPPWVENLALFTSLQSQFGSQGQNCRRSGNAFARPYACIYIYIYIYMLSLLLWAVPEESALWKGSGRKHLVNI